MNAKQAREKTDNAIKEKYDVSVYIEEIDILINSASSNCSDNIHYNTSKNNLKIIEIKGIVDHYEDELFCVEKCVLNKKGYINITW